MPNSLYYNPSKSQINCLQQIQNCFARTVVKAPKSSLVTAILRSLHWLKINERIEYKKAVLPQGNRAMPQVFFSVEVRQQHSLQV